MAIETIIAPTAEPVTLEMARLHLRLDVEGSPPSHPDDDLVRVFIAAARGTIETHTGIRIMPQTVRCGFASFGSNGALLLPVGPVVEVSEVEYTDTAGAAQTLPADQWRLEVKGGPPAPAYLVQPAGVVWPAGSTVLVTASVGYQPVGSPPEPIPSSIPPEVSAAVLLLVGEYYRNREAGGPAAPGASNDLPSTVQSLMALFRQVWGVA